MSYASFAQYYDSLTHNVEYARRADYLCTLLAHLGHAPGLTLDLACGTGSLTVELAKRGMDIYGIDGSADMLSVARQKAAESGLDLLFLCQKMQKLDLYGTVDTVICAGMGGDTIAGILRLGQHQPFDAGKGCTDRL